MILFDINILVYAHREDQQEHNYYQQRLESVISEGTIFALTPLVAGGFLRVVTNPNFPNGPTPQSQALAVIDSLLSHPRAQLLLPGRRHWEIFSDLCRKSSAIGKQVADAQHAAIAIEHAGTWISRDTDFARFTQHGLKWQRWEPSSL